jgi:hypothetical protein
MNDTTIQECLKVLASTFWPAVAILLVFHFRQPLSNLLYAVTRLLEDPNTAIKLTREGVEIRQNVNAVLGRIESFETELRQIRAILPTAHSEGVRTASDSLELPPALQQAADEYLKIIAPTWKERVRLKDTAAVQLTKIVQEYQVSKDLLSQQAHEGLLLALAGVIHSNPESGDLDRLITIAPRLERLHVKYRVVMAIGRLFERNLVTEADVGRALALLGNFSEGADAALLQRIMRTRAIINTVSQGVISPT